MPSNVIGNTNSSVSEPVEEGKRTSTSQAQPAIEFDFDYF